MLIKNKGQMPVNFIVGLIVLMIGILSITIVSFGFMFENQFLIIVGSLVLLIFSAVTIILEWVMLK